MNYLIEPCCATRHMQSLRKAIGKSGTAQFEGYGDLSLTELLPAILTRYDDVEMIIAAPALPDQAAEIIAKWMSVRWARMDGNGKVYAIRHLTVIAGLGRRRSPLASAWKKENPFGGRLTLVDSQQADTVILLPDFAITGPVNMRYGEHFTATATSNPMRIADLWRLYASAGGHDEPEEEEASAVPGTPAKAAEAAGAVSTAEDAEADMLHHGAAGGAAL